MNKATQPTPTSHFFTSLRTRLHYLDWGNPSAPPLILVHGGFDHARSWDWTARTLARDYHVICPDLRGHGDSGWSSDGSYMMANYVYDLAQLVELLDRRPVTIVGHSLGGSISLRYTGLYPESVARVVAIEGLGLSPDRIAEQAKRSTEETWKGWIDTRRTNARRSPRHYATIEAAVARMRERNDHLSVEQALHLTLHGVNRNEDGSYSWKFDPYLHGAAPSRHRRKSARLLAPHHLPDAAVPRPRQLGVKPGQGWSHRPFPAGPAGGISPCRPLAASRPVRDVRQGTARLPGGMRYGLRP